MSDNAIICDGIKDIYKYLESISVMSFPHFPIYGEKIPINKQKTDPFPGNFNFRLFSMFLQIKTGLLNIFVVLIKRNEDGDGASYANSKKAIGLDRSP